MSQQQQPVPVQLRPVEIDVITVGTPKDMEDAVNQRLQQGWLFHGDMKVVVTTENVSMWSKEYVGGSPMTFVQAMVKVEPVPMQMPPRDRSSIVIPQ
jgi:hypothetical protein